MSCSLSAGTRRLGLGCQERERERERKREQSAKSSELYRKVIMYFHTYLWSTDYFIVVMELLQRLRERDDLSQGETATLRAA